MVHFDVSGCFSDPSWSAIVDCFRQDAPHPQGASARARSGSVRCGVGETELRLGMELAGIVGTGGPKDGLHLGLDLGAFLAYFEAADCPERKGDVLHVVSLLRCGERIERKGAAVLRYQDRRLVRGDRRHFWHLVPYGNCVGHLLSVHVEPEPGSSAAAGPCREAFSLEEDLGSAQWNADLPHGTDFAPLVWFPENEFAAEPFAPGAFDGAVALLRRGGGLGFVQKVQAAQDAGAVGCIIYEGEGDRASMGRIWAMGQRWMGVDHPAPGIPGVLVGEEAAGRLKALATPPGRVRVRIGLEYSDEALRRPMRSFQDFREAAAQGEPVHLAVLVERASAAGGPLDEPELGWFRELDPRERPPPFDPLNASTVHIGTVHISPI